MFFCSSRCVWHISSPEKPEKTCQCKSPSLPNVTYMMIYIDALDTLKA